MLHFLQHGQGFGFRHGPLRQCGWWRRIAHLQVFKLLDQALEQAAVGIVDATVVIACRSTAICIGGIFFFGLAGILGRRNGYFNGLAADAFFFVLDDQVRQSDENPSIGIILCKDKKRMIVEYALRDARKPIGVATYAITRELPENLQGQLPSASVISRLLRSL